MNIPQIPGLSRRRLIALIEQSPAHLVPIWTVVRDHGVIFALVEQGGRPFRLRVTTSPTIALIGDDQEAAHGPAGFHGPSLQAACKRALAAVIVAGAPMPQLYIAAAAVAVLKRRHVVIVETRLEQEIPWIEFIRSACPNIRILVGTVKGGRA